MPSTTSSRRLAAASLPLFLVAAFACDGSKGEDPVAAKPAPPSSAAGPSAAATGGQAPPAVAATPGAVAPRGPAAPAAAGSGPGAEPASPVPAGIDPKQPVAVVNGAPISAEKAYTVYQMNKDMIQARGRTLSENDDRALKVTSLEVCIADELMYQAAVKGGFKVAAPEVDAAMKQFRSRLGSEETYKMFLQGSGLDEAGVRAELERNLQTEAYRKSLVAGQGVSEDKVRAFYASNQEMFKVPEQVHAQYILVVAADADPEAVRADAKKRIDEARARAAAGEDFAALAKQYSQDATAARGGDIGFFPRGVMFPKFEEVAFALKVGDVSEVFQTPKGYNVLKVLARKPEAIRPFDEVKNALTLDMGRLVENDIVQSKMQELAAAAKIDILDKSFEMPKVPAQPPVAGAKGGAPK